MSSKLPTRPLGSSGLNITPVGFGAWAIGGGGWSFGWGPQDDTASLAAMRRALELGVNWIDTAAVYGLGLVIRNGPAQVVTVGPDSTLSYSSVTIGRDYGSWVEVTGGLAPGASVVLNPTDDLQAGQRVRVVS